MKELVMFILLNLQKFGELDSVKMYDKNFTSIDFSDDDSSFQINISRKDKGEQNNDTF